MAKRVLLDKAILYVPIERAALAALEALASRDGLTVNSYARMMLLRHLRDDTMTAAHDNGGAYECRCGTSFTCKTPTALRANIDAHKRMCAVAS